ncbi:hypothetical protein Aduo_005996 [Ancylostoma duodenale]
MDREFLRGKTWASVAERATPMPEREKPPGRATVLPDLYQVSCIEMPTQADRLLTQFSKPASRMPPSTPRPPTFPAAIL